MEIKHEAKIVSKQHVCWSIRVQVIHASYMCKISERRLSLEMLELS